MRLKTKKSPEHKKDPTDTDYTDPPGVEAIKSFVLLVTSEEYAGTLETLAGLSIDHLVSGTMGLCDTNS